MFAYKDCVNYEMKSVKALSSFVAFLHVSPLLLSYMSSWLQLEDIRCIHVQTNGGQRVHRVHSQCFIVIHDEHKVYFSYLLIVFTGHCRLKILCGRFASAELAQARPN